MDKYSLVSGDHLVISTYKTKQVKMREHKNDEAKRYNFTIFYSLCLYFHKWYCINNKYWNKQNSR